MAWLGDDTSERVDQATYNFRVRYSTYKRLIDDGVTDIADPLAITYVDTTEMVRRIRQNIITYVWPGLSHAYTQSKLALLRSDFSYKNPTAKWNGSGGYDVSATRVMTDPAGWSSWVALEESEELWQGSPWS